MSRESADGEFIYRQYTDTATRGFAVRVPTYFGTYKTSEQAEFVRERVARELKEFERLLKEEALKAWNELHPERASDT